MTVPARSQPSDIITTALQRVMETEQYTEHQAAVDAAVRAVQEAEEALRQAEEAASAPEASKRAKNLVGFSEGERNAARDALALAEDEQCAFVAEETERQVKILEEASKPALPASAATKGAEVVLNDPPCDRCVEKKRVCQRQPKRPTSVACLQCVRCSIACSLVPGPKRSRKRPSDVQSSSPRKRQHAVEKAHVETSSTAPVQLGSEEIDLLHRIDRRSARNARNMTLLMFKICEAQNMELPTAWEEHSGSETEDGEED